MLDDQRIVKATSNITQRVEKQKDIDKILKTFVDIGIVPQINNVNDQIIYGRRGTGKTHVLKVLQNKVESDTNKASVYIDCRTLGSTAQFSDSSVPIQKRCTALFKDILEPIHSRVLNYIVDNPPDQKEQQEEVLELSDRLASVVTQAVKRYEQVSETRTASKESQARGNIEVNVSSTGPKAGAGTGRSSSESGEVTSTYDVETEDKIIFPSLYKSLSNILELSNLQLFILIDEWAAIPEDIQPYLAEFLKRGVLPVRRSALKVATLEYRTSFRKEGSEPIVGFELGADISTAVDLDDYYVYDRNPEQITDVFSEILYKHITSDLDDGYMSNKHSIGNGEDLSTRLFTQRKIFRELVRAAEGVVRDLLNIYQTAFFDAKRRGRDTIDQNAVIDSSREWFEKDKSQGLDEKMESVLESIVSQVIGEKNARSFMVPRELQDHPMIQRLFDERVIHKMEKGYADKDNPGRRYDIYTLDYGTYVDLKGTKSEPEYTLFSGLKNKNDDIVVPFDDKRSIRRIILDKEVLEPY
jgi:hypothetical protein